MIQPPDSVTVEGGGGWLYSSKLFDKFRRDIESRTCWKHSGTCDLLLTNAYFDEYAAEARIDFASTVLCDLEAMMDQKAILSVGRFFESVFRFSESSYGSNPCWSFSNEQGLAMGRSALERVVLSLLPSKIGDDLAKAKHFAVRDVSKPT